MKYTLRFPHQKLQGTVRLPASKSISNRRLVIRALCDEKFALRGLSDSDDTKALQAGLESESDVIDIGHAGTSMRFLTAYFAATGKAKTLTGSERMKNRPIGDLVDTLNQAGADIRFLEKPGFPPIRTSGKLLSGNTVNIKGNVSSQFISAVLLVAPSLPEGLNVRIDGDPVSASYIRMTLELMRRAGAAAIHSGSTIHIAPQRYRPDDAAVERDRSAASYWYEIASLAEESELLLAGISDSDLQGDAAASRLFVAAGVHTEYLPEGALLTKTTGTGARRDIDFIEAPDLVQTMAVTFCLKNIPFRFGGVQTLRVKETDRIAALQTELLKLGYCIEAPEHGIIEWNGKRTEPQREISIATYHDHRMAMAFAPAAALFPGLQIEDPAVVSKSYPKFWDDLTGAGFIIEEIEDASAPAGIKTTNFPRKRNFHL